MVLIAKFDAPGLHVNTDAVILSFPILKSGAEEKLRKGHLYIILADDCPPNFSFSQPLNHEVNSGAIAASNATLRNVNIPHRQSTGYVNCRKSTQTSSPHLQNPRMWVEHGTLWFSGNLHICQRKSCTLIAAMQLAPPPTIVVHGVAQ